MRRSKQGRRLVCVNKVGGELSFSLDVDNSSESDAEADALDHLSRLLCHLGAELQTMSAFLSDG